MLMNFLKIPQPKLRPRADGDWRNGGNFVGSTVNQNLRSSKLNLRQISHVLSVKGKLFRNKPSGLAHDNIKSTLVIVIHFPHQWMILRTLRGVIDTLNLDSTRVEKNLQISKFDPSENYKSIGSTDDSDIKHLFGEGRTQCPRKLSRRQPPELKFHNPKAVKPVDNSVTAKLPARWFGARAQP
ncbi:hypothetical protein WN51_02510 [Melipona quadrifasciata]|uniref:Uncharacterized protein n=1 Tax=Melipona quadrifasciata TaxID=166423 RepID=A0A0N0BDH2_9HYME|nr:hypothetical protein WN51_02510 [Melipona quadrifasciata]